MSCAHVLRSALLAFTLVTSVAGCAAVSGQETAGEYVDDATISTKVRAAIIDELETQQIGVETMQRVVQLSGFVDSAEIKAKAGHIAGSVSGVKHVSNDIIVR